MSNASATTCLTSAEGYRLWAGTYDHEGNPMLSLESRVLAPLLPRVAGLDVMDLGCGTGRWLEVLKQSGARSLVGVDLSREMLDVAAAKLGDTLRLVHGDWAEIPFAHNSADLVLCNFVLSYIEDAEAFLKRVRWVLRSGGSLFITDIHPGTASALNWRRGPGSKENFHEIRVSQRPIEEVVSICEHAGLQVRVRLEPRFEEPERRIFKASGKQEYFDRIQEFPAIYVLQLTLASEDRRASVDSMDPVTTNALYGGRFALGPHDSFRGEMSIAGSQIASLREESRDTADRSDFFEAVDLRGFLVLPGLVNAHDHLEFALFPRLGGGGYINFLEWVDDIYHPGMSPIAEHRAVQRATRLWWGGLRNLLCGVTTVCHHNPYETDVFDVNFAIRALKDYGWAHSLALDSQVSEKRKATPGGQPFLIHLAEGIDERSREEIVELKNLSALDRNTVVIHGLGMDQQGRELLRAAGAGLIWCPSSNVFLFGKTLSPRELRELDNVALGSDSPLTAQGDLLDELRYAREWQSADAEDLYSYVTENPAMMLALKNGEGTFRVGGVADLIAVRDIGETPANTLASLSYREVELVVIDGRVQLTSDEIRSRLPERCTRELRPLIVEGIRRWVRAPLEKMFADTTPHLGNEIYLGRKQVRLGTAN